MRFSSPEIKERYEFLHPKAKEIMEDMDSFAQVEFNKELTFTDTVTTWAEDVALKRVSDTHRTRRAWDIRIRDLTDNEIARLCAYTRKKWGKFGAVVNGTPSLIVYKPHGSGPHLHCQLNRQFALPILKEELDGKEKEPTA